MKAAALQLALLIVLIAAPVETANAADENPDADWSASLSVDIGVVFTSFSGSVSASDSAGVPLTEPDSGDELFVSPLLGIGIEGLSPRLPGVPISPRIVAGFSVAPTFSSALTVAGTGSPGPLVPPDTPRFEEGAIEGQGSRTKVTLTSPALGAKLGLSFPFSVRSQRFRFQVMAEWRRLEFDVEGIVSRAIKPDNNDPFYRAVTLEQQGRLALDGVGPSAALEGIAGEIGPFTLAYYAGIGAYRVLNDRSLVLHDAVTITDSLGTDTYTATWAVEASEWQIHTRAGVRLSWPNP